MPNGTGEEERKEGVSQRRSLFEKLMENQASKNPLPARKMSNWKGRKDSKSEKSSPLNKVVRTTRMKGNQNMSNLVNTGQNSIKSFLERKLKDHSGHLFQNSGIVEEIRDQTSKVVQSYESDFKTTEASNIPKQTAHQLNNTATARKMDI